MRKQKEKKKGRKEDVGEESEKGKEEESCGQKSCRQREQNREYKYKRIKKVIVLMDREKNKMVERK